MADYAAHKRQVDAEHPASRNPVWYLTPEAHDNPAHSKDDFEVAHGTATRLWAKHTTLGLLSITWIGVISHCD